MTNLSGGDGSAVAPFRKRYKFDGSLAGTSLTVDVDWDGRRLSMTGEVREFDGLYTRVVSSGQSILSFREYDPRGSRAAPDFFKDEDRVSGLRLLDIWDRWHLNDLVAGSPAQEAALRAAFEKEPEMRHFDWAKGVLARANMDPDPETGYSYGSQWLYEEVPTDILNYLKGEGGD